MTAAPVDVLVLGSVNQDQFLEVDHYPSPGETVLARVRSRSTGGKGANQAIAAARWGAHVAFCGAVGADAAGQAALEHLSGAGVALITCTLNDTATGLATIMVRADGQNAIVLDPGANMRLPISLARQAATQHPAGVVLAQLEAPVAAVAELFTTSKESLRILNAAPMVPGASELLTHTDVLIVNEVEAHQLRAQIHGDTVGHPHADRGQAAVDAAHTDAIALRHALPLTAVVITLGPMGALAVTPDGVEHVPAHPVEVIDTTGAGDAFCGAFAATCARGMTWVEAMREATRAAAAAVSHHGAGLPADAFAPPDSHNPKEIA